jgi:hypothetical protein
MSNDYPTANFAGACGEASGKTPNSATCAGGMQPFQQAALNGSAPSNCMVGNDGATVYGITLTNSPGIYDYVITVDGKGPSGIGSGYFHLAFTDETNDTYYLKIFSSKRESHTVRYNSSKPNIVKIWWCNYDFDVPSAAKGVKPDYAVASPVREDA